MKKTGGLLPLAGLLALVGALALAARPTTLGRVLELKTLDWRAQTFADPARRDPSIVLVAVDQASLDAFEKDAVFWPWPRGIYGGLLAFLKKGGAKAVVFDVLFSNPSMMMADQDAALGAALKDFGNAVMAMDSGSKANALRAVAPPARFAVDPGPALAAAAPRRAAFRPPIPEVLAGARFLGDTTADADLDGVFRRVPLAVEMGGKLFPTLPAAAAMAATGKTLAELAPPLVDGAMLVRFEGKAMTSDPRIKTYDSYPAATLIAGEQALEEGKKPELDPALFKDKVVFVALSAPGLFDNHPTPVATVMPGTEVVAAAADGLINRRWIEKAPAASLPLLVALALLAAGAASRSSSRAGASLGSAALASLALAAAACAAYRRGVWLDLAAPQLALWLGFGAASAYGYAVEGRQKRYIQGAFSFYLSPEVVKQIAESPEKLALGGERREVTVYFSDIEGFTTLSEKLEPEKLTKLMNRYLGEMTDTILASGGTLDKYIGDAIMAFWGAPLADPDHALTACRIALANQKKLAALREELVRQGLPAIRNRIGLNSGPASIGNMGSAKRFSYTAIGDTVNLASRLEGANKAYGSYILISETTRAAAGAAVEARELDYVKVKGKNLPIRVYELLGLSGETDPRLLEKARRFEKGLALYRARDFAAAGAVFEAVQKEFGPDHASEVYAEHCREHIAEPPSPDWDGSHALTEK
ncbi:MAG: adenylate/guanylate cyclase domain-containing protein [Elusimicrobia bacterium]|nr:adenylate/guanylate cyclase domain-containing protein [Elusimicrobiota bacterium]